MAHWCDIWTCFRYDPSTRTGFVSLMGTQYRKFAVLAKSRRSVRVYEDRPITDDLLRELLETAIWSPSAHNRQPWRFAVVRDPARKELLANRMAHQLRKDLEADGVAEEMIAADTGRSTTRMISASALVVLCFTMVDMDRYPDAKRSEAERIMAMQSAAMAGQNLLLAAHAAGLGACWMCAPLFCPDVVRDSLELPQDWEPQALITLGYPAQSRTRTREPLETRVVWR
ncbi:MAG: nitroreductase family protein [Anaerolineae bacterium]|nr:MAG: nitroreductase family protein [Anaerolineae bacterium]